MPSALFLWCSAVLLFCFRVVSRCVRRIEQTVSSTEDTEFRPAVQGVADFLLFFRQFFDESFRQRVVLMQERIPFRQSFADDFRACLAVSDGSQTVGSDAVCYQVLYHGFCPALGEADVVFIPSPVVAMRAEFNRDVRIVFHERDE